MTADGIRRVACPLHEKARKKRLASEKGIFRRGEVNLDTTFWNCVTKQNDKDKDGTSNANHTDNLHSDTIYSSKEAAKVQEERTSPLLTTQSSKQTP